MLMGSVDYFITVQLELLWDGPIPPHWAWMHWDLFIYPMLHSFKRLNLIHGVSNLCRPAFLSTTPPEKTSVVRPNTARWGKQLDELFSPRKLSQMLLKMQRKANIQTVLAVLNWPNEIFVGIYMYIKYICAWICVYT